MIRIRPDFIVVTAAIVLVGAMAWRLSAMVTRHAMIEQRKAEVLEWVAQQNGWAESLREIRRHPVIEQRDSREFSPFECDSGT